LKNPKQEGGAEERPAAPGIGDGAGHEAGQPPKQRGGKAGLERGECLPPYESNKRKLERAALPAPHVARGTGKLNVDPVLGDLQFVFTEGAESGGYSFGL
jgi:hypothetical protein